MSGATRPWRTTLAPILTSFSRSAVSDQCSTSLGDVDRYGRVVATCFVGVTDLGCWMVAHGWAVAYRRYSDRYIADEQAARDAGAGIWVGTFIMPWNWRRDEP